MSLQPLLVEPHPSSKTWLKFQPIGFIVKRSFLLIT